SRHAVLGHPSKYSREPSLEGGPRDAGAAIRAAPPKPLRRPGPFVRESLCRLPPRAQGNYGAKATSLWLPLAGKVPGRSKPAGRSRGRTQFECLAEDSPCQRGDNELRDTRASYDFERFLAMIDQ